jgi:hypothetical protein
LDVSKTPYNAEYGHFSEGLTTVVTKAPADKYNFQLFDAVPSFRGEEAISRASMATRFASDSPGRLDL